MNIYYLGAPRFPAPREKLICSAAYLSGGILGIVFLILGWAEQRFVRYHVYQSLFLGILFTLLDLGVDIIFSLLASLSSFWPEGNVVIVMIGKWSERILAFLFFGLLVYCVFTVWRNQYTWIKWVSTQVNKIV